MEQNKKSIIPEIVGYICLAAVFITLITSVPSIMEKEAEKQMKLKEQENKHQQQMLDKILLITECQLIKSTYE